MSRARAKQYQGVEVDVEETEDEFLSEPEHDTSHVVGSEEELEEDNEYLAVTKTSDFKMMFVSWEQIKPLFSRCIQCGSKANMRELHTIGTTIFVSTEFTLGHKCLELS